MYSSWRVSLNYRKIVTIFPCHLVSSISTVAWAEGEQSTSSEARCLHVALAEGDPGRDSAARGRGSLE